MPKMKTNKTAAKRFKKSKPRGGKNPKVLYVKSGQAHLRTKKSNRRKNRVLPSHTVSKADEKVIYKLIGK